MKVTEQVQTQLNKVKEGKRKKTSELKVRRTWEEWVIVIITTHIGMTYREGKISQNRQKQS